MSAPQIYKVQDLTEQQKSIIKASVPVLEESGLTLTSTFYKNMLENYPEVRPFFNETNQTTLRQPKILAFALLHYAKCIDDLSPLTDFVLQIVAKHVGLQVRAEHYPIVGNTLIATMKALLGDEVANGEFVGAWAAAYGNLAQLLINAEWEAYQAQPWQEFRLFTVTKLTNDACDVKSVYLAPVEGKIAMPERGQYLCFRFNVSGKETSREYSISQYPQNHEYRISVRRLEAGVVSNYIHHQLKVGDKVKVAPPAGKFCYHATSNDILVFAGGIGITPLVLIIEQALADGHNVRLFNSNRTEESVPFRHWLESIAADNFTVTNFISKNGQRLSAKHFDALEPGEYDTYLIGPPAYMSYVKSELFSRISGPVYSEFFGPTLV